MAAAGTYLVTVPLAELDSSLIEVQRYKENEVIEVTLHTFNKKEAINFTWEESYNNRPAERKEFNSDKTTVAFREQEIAERVAKAFASAIKICGGSRKEPF